ncbi:tRNA-dependent cyclodipeptide synthase [Kitasatospora sp. NPDC057015]|uniref:tRNA-dependent cyclodipeptide synthase n=1 Tax=Kitasatospora sp. NPDC057015 TaxID=3346001 RepID=UPI00362AC51B
MSETLLGSAPTLFEAQPFSPRCQAIWRRGDHLLIGVSPGNSYFGHQRIRELVGWASEFFDSVDIVYADLHVEAQYEAFGHPPEHALRRAAKEVKATARRIRRGVEEAGRPGVGVHPLSSFLDDPGYRRLHGSVLEALRTDEVLREAAEGMARSFLSARLGEGLPPTADQLAAGLRYIAAELPFFLDTPALLSVPSSVSCYHVQLPLTPVLFGRESGLRAAPGQAYAVVRRAAVPGSAPPAAA